MAVPVPLDPGAGVVLTSTATHSWYQTLAYLLAPPSCRLTKTAATTTGAIGVFGAVAFDAESYDATGMHDNVTNNSRITIAQTGQYRLNGKLRTSTNTSLGAKFAVNGTALAETEMWAGFAASAYADVAIDTTVALVAGQYVELLAATTTATVAVGPTACYFEARWVSN